MAYTHSKYERVVASAAALSSTGDKGAFAPGMVPHIVRAVAAVIKTVPAAAGVLKFDKRPTAGSDTGRGDGDVAVINLATSHTAGTVVYKDGLNALIKPGEEVVAEVTTATGTGGVAEIIAYVEPSWEVPGNNTRMRPTT